ncbi:GIY-YIG nuclease family protein [Rhodococcus ruber]|uniref:GIY-YIG nuclease family protein n=1 Tax=Rhodococcus ruber TaxID=1830 RepID=UPI003D812866
MTAGAEARDHFVYRMYDAAGALLYVGCTKRPELRWKEHRSVRPHMIRRVQRVHLFGPTTRTKAREIEYFAIRNEGPEFGWTPKKHAAKVARNRWIDDRLRFHVSGGMELSDALTLAVDEAEALIPDPMADEYPRVPRVRRMKKAAS